jgi:hypothetical protein
MNLVRTRLVPPRPALAGQRGFAASVIVLALAAVMAALLLSTTRTVAALDRELRLVEQRQLRKYALPSPAPARPRPPSSPASQGADTN